MVRKPLDEIEVYQHSYDGTILADVEAWLNEGTSGYTAEFAGWQNTLVIKKDGLEVTQVYPGDSLVRDLNDDLHNLNASLLASFYQPAL